METLNMMLKWLVIGDYHEFDKKMISLACKSIEKIDNKEKIEETDFQKWKDMLAMAKDGL